MGIWVDTILDREVETLEQARGVAAAMVAWLVDRRIIEDRQSSGCAGDGSCYPAGRNFMQVARIASGDADTGSDEVSHACMRVVVGREFLFNLSASFDRIACPVCRKDIGCSTYLDAGSAWVEGGSDQVTCPECGAISRLREWEHAESGFATLGFEFFGWPEFSPEFIAEFSHRIGHRTTCFSEKR